MAKFRSPLNTNELWITQTYHSGSNNTAVDFSAVTDAPVHAVADGKVTYRSSGAGSYCIQHIDNSDLKVYYVHTYKWVGANTHLKKGQIIARIAPSSVNGGYPTHLHLGLQLGKYLMDYMDRSITMKTRFSAIKNIWFKGERFNWGKHKDLSYLNNAMSFKKGDKIEFTGSQNIRKGSGTSYSITGSTKAGDVATIIDGPRTANNYTWWDMKFDKGGTGWVADVSKFKIYTAPAPEPPPPPPPPTDPTIELKERIVTLKKEISGLRTALSDSQDRNTMLEGLIKAQEKREETLRENILELNNIIADIQEQMGGLEGELEETRKERDEIQEKYDALYVNYNRIENEKSDWMEKYEDLKRECAKESPLKLLFNKLSELIKRLGR